MLFVTIAAAALLAQPAPERRWERIGAEPIGEAFIDPASISRQGDVVSVTMRHVFPRVTGGIKSLISFGTVDCAARTRTATRLEGYREDGSLQRAVELPPERRMAGPVGTSPVDEALIRRACGRGGG